MTNFILTAAAVAAVASMMRYDVRGSTSMLREHEAVRIWMEEASAEAKNGEMPKIGDKTKPPTKDPPRKRHAPDPTGRIRSLKASPR